MWMRVRVRMLMRVQVQVQVRMLMLMRMPYRASVVFPSMRLPGAIRALHHPWCACHVTRTALIDHRYALLGI